MDIVFSSQFKSFVFSFILQTIVKIDPIIINSMPTIILTGINSFISIKAKIGDKTGLKKNTKEVVFADVFSIDLK